MTVTIRPATEQDQATIRAMAHKERVNPTQLDWPNFMLAIDDGAVVGAAQMRKHCDGSRELATLVVREEARGRSIATRLIDALLAREPGPVFMITGERYADHYARWGFRRREPTAVPGAVRRNYRMGTYGGGLISFFMGRPRRRLAIFERTPAAA
jgi:amino-acid N-acetyltransferase